ncbi:hypothetical protein CDD83_2475 [Cordyceps sp. RAO-2017]|nr:hypothetical protein CDD83_2475 [Cordyceps sp. RAO-2017]
MRWLPLAVLASALIFPPGMKDGDYLATLPDDDNPSKAVVWRDAATAPKQLLLRRDKKSPSAWSPPGRNPRLQKDTLPVPVTMVTCDYESITFGAYNYLQARAGLFTYCERFLLPSRSIHISVSNNGSIGVFACNYTWTGWIHGAGHRICSGREYRFVEQNFLDPQCGQLRTGQAFIKSMKKWYGRARPGDRICQDDPLSWSTTWTADQNAHHPIYECPTGGCGPGWREKDMTAAEAAAASGADPRGDDPDFIPQDAGGESYEDDELLTRLLDIQDEDLVSRRKAMEDTLARVIMDGPEG